MAEHKPDTTRKPKPLYRNTNGFRDETRGRVQGSIRVPNLHGVGAADMDAAHQRSVRDAVERRRLVEDVLQLKGSYFPGVAVAKELGERPETAAIVRERINELEKRHFEEMQTYYDWQVEDYYAAAEDRYLSKDDGVPDSQIDTFYRTSRGVYPHERSVEDDAVSSLRHAHLDTMFGLRHQYKSLVAREDAERRRRDAQFPADLAAFNAIQNKDIQLRIAKFLALTDRSAKERLLTEYQWAWRQAENLMNEYKVNETFRKKIEVLLHESETHDPRRRVTGS